jgi:hypothetical protein
MFYLPWKVSLEVEEVVKGEVAPQSPLVLFLPLLQL